MASGGNDDEAVRNESVCEDSDSDLGMTMRMRQGMQMFANKGPSAGVYVECIGEVARTSHCVGGTI